ncbi:unnamed protein product [Euphydryas editha]|uniref:Major facilitator superfamily (MFS) profile domain-containing protein n=1 Tax=Euphydryas editha TaxID=104508 RepID=A0AAU9VBF6_EUPED|nr:unnamed protein product [Euphydryas editha]
MSKKDKTDPKSDDVLNVLQKFGKYQIIQYLYICLPTIIISTANVNYVFVAGDIDYRCRVPECESIDNTLSPSWWNYSRESLDSKLNRCHKPVLNKTYLEVNVCDNRSFTSQFVDCEEWVYGSNDTIVAWLNLACHPWKTNLVGTIHSLGSVFGMMFGGKVADRFGRKPTCILMVIAFTVGNIKTFIRSYYGYIFIELVEAVTAGAAFAAAMVLIIEISGNNQRILSGVVFAYAIYLGEALLAVIAIILPYWKYMVYMIYIPPIFFVSYICVLEESPRWLVLQNRLDEARRILKLITKSNNININHDELDQLDKENLRQICDIEEDPKKEGYKEALFSKEIVKRLFIITVSRFSITFIYYGLTANSVWLPGNKYTNYVLTAIASFPGDVLVLYFMNKWGRRMPLFYGYMVCGVSCVASAYVPEALIWLRVVIYMIAKLTAAACFTGIWTYTMELFPTSIRGSMFGLCTVLASPGVMLAPLVPAMDTISPLFAPIFFACSSVFSGFLILLAPETKDRPLPGTIQNVNNGVFTSKLSTNNGGEDNTGFQL